MKYIHLIPETPKGNIYLTSDDHINSGEWVLSVNGVYKGMITQVIGEPDGSVWKKIIMTTNESLIKDGIEAISKEFLNKDK